MRRAGHYPARGRLVIDEAFRAEVGDLLKAMGAVADELALAGKLRASGVMLAAVQAIRALATKLEPPAEAPTEAPPGPHLEAV